MGKKICIVSDTLTKDDIFILKPYHTRAGRRFDCIVVDDIHEETYNRTPEQLLEWFWKVPMCAIKPKGKIFTLGPFRVEIEVKEERDRMYAMASELGKPLQEVKDKVVLNHLNLVKDGDALKALEKEMWEKRVAAEMEKYLNEKLDKGID